MVELESSSGKGMYTAKAIQLAKIAINIKISNGLKKKRVKENTAECTTERRAILQDSIHINYNTRYKHILNSQLRTTKERMTLFAGGE